MAAEQLAQTSAYTGQGHIVDSTAKESWVVPGAGSRSYSSARHSLSRVKLKPWNRGDEFIPTLSDTQNELKIAATSVSDLIRTPRPIGRKDSDPPNWAMVDSVLSPTGLE
jgi:hypothetical protein